MAISVLLVLMRYDLTNSVLLVLIMRYDLTNSVFLVLIMRYDLINCFGGLNIWDMTWQTQFFKS